MANEITVQCDVAVVGTGVAGALIAKWLGSRGLKVVILEAGGKVPPNLNDYMSRFYNISKKVPESPYPPDLRADPSRVNAGRPTSLMLGKPERESYLIQKGPKNFSSTYERLGGGTAMHWLGTSLRLLPSDFRMSAYDKGLFTDWPIDYDTLDPWYQKAEWELGVSADTEQQAFLGIHFRQPYEYPMPPIPGSLVDQAVGGALTRLTAKALDFLGLDTGVWPLRVTPTAAARNSQPFQSRRVCAGNTNCIPICPIQAKYDPTVTLKDALDTGNVRILYRTVAKEVIVAPPTAGHANSDVVRIDYLQYARDIGPITGKGSISARAYVIAGNAIETARLLLMSKSGGKRPTGIANSSNQVGRNLMDHPYYVAWALADEPVFPYRGPLSTGGVEDVIRDGPFRRERAAFRIEIGNEGWNFVVAGGSKGSDPNVTTLDFVNGLNFSGANEHAGRTLFGADLVNQLNYTLTRQLRLGFLIEQTPDPNNRIVLSDAFTDGLGLPRPEIHYDLSDYTKRGIVAAKQTADAIFSALPARQFTTSDPRNTRGTFNWTIGGKLVNISFQGAGHVMGTYRMGTDPAKSVVDPDQRSWDHRNLYLVGSGTFPTTGTANPTLTIAALSLRTADAIERRLKSRAV